MSNCRNKYIFKFHTHSSLIFVCAEKQANGVRFRRQRWNIDLIALRYNSKLTKRVSCYLAHVTVKSLDSWDHQPMAIDYVSRAHAGRCYWLIFFVPFHSTVEAQDSWEYRPIACDLVHRCLWLIFVSFKTETFKHGTTSR